VGRAILEGHYAAKLQLGKEIADADGEYMYHSHI